ncbi:MAG TPA: DUF4384 domain-containing protein [Gemmatimonadales bacterium]|nr:DUF4384 domain-containing protein [Gemmatimonadales bacterium]
MTVHLAITLALLAQTGAAPARAPRLDTPPVRVWLPDSTPSVGDAAQVYVALRDTSHLVVLHVDPSGRIRVLFPRSPTASDLVPGGETFAVGGIEEGLTFRVPGPGIGTILAVRASARTPFRFEGLATGSGWDYEHALLLQPTAGNPFAALLDIADRIANGEAYNYDLAGYRTPGATVARRLQPDTVCFSCLAARHSGRRGSAEGYGEISNSAIAIDHSYAAAPGGTVVDCSSATLVDSWCGVQDNSVSTTVTETSTYESTTYVTPIEEPFFFPFRRFRRMRREPAPAPFPPAIALNLRRVPGRVVPPPARKPPRIVVQQPTARSRPIPAPAAVAPAAPVTTVAPGTGSRSIVRRTASAPAARRADGSAAAAAGGWSAAAPRGTGTTAAPRVAAPAVGRPAAAAAQAARPTATSSRTGTRAYANPRD